jgi:hypothetical protein
VPKPVAVLVGLLVSDAQSVNAFAALTQYLDTCRRQRGQIPKYVAVNYFDKGDVFNAVDHLNGFE